MSVRELKTRIIPPDDSLRFVLGKIEKIAPGNFRTQFVLGNPDAPIISDKVIMIIRNAPVSEETRRSLLERADQLNKGLDVEIDVPELPEDF